MDYIYRRPEYPTGYVPMPTVNYPEYQDATAYSYNMNPRGGQRLKLRWDLTMYALRGLGMWLIGEWKSEASARVYEKSGSEYKYRGCIGFKEANPLTKPAKVGVAPPVAEVVSTS